jgi:2Fe-2S ferredoxin
MAKITYIEHGGVAHTVDVTSGLSVMEGAIKNGIPGIEADCGGACSCATCHVYIAPEWEAVVGPPEELESSMLEAAVGVRPNSRLSCQVKVTDALDGLVVSVPETQF